MSETLEQKKARLRALRIARDGAAAVESRKAGAAAQIARNQRRNARRGRVLGSELILAAHQVDEGLGLIVAEIIARGLTSKA